MDRDAELSVVVVVGVVVVVVIEGGLGRVGLRVVGDVERVVRYVVERVVGGVDGRVTGFLVGIG